MLRIAAPLFRYSQQLSTTPARFYSSDYASKFESAQQNVKNLKESPDNDIKLKLYALFKQATSGDVQGKQPSMINFVERAKYDAWAGFKGLTNSDAQKKYVEVVEGLIAEEKGGEVNESGPGVTQGVDGLKISMENHVYRIEFNRPKKFNALTFDMYNGIIKALEEASANKETKFVVFSGAGQYYCSGNDLSNFEKAAKIGKEKLADEARELFQRFVAAFIDFDKPIIGLINGPAVGISVTLLPLFNIVWASDSATFNTPFVAIAQSAEGTSTYTFPYLMGYAKASEFLLFGRKLTAEEACERNLVNEVFPATTFLEECNRRIAEYAKLPPEALKVNKQVLRDVHRDTLHKVNKHESAVLRDRWVSKECEEALMAFMLRKKK
uniref:ACB domain-containing protein n=1 Tax=Panagrolaimus superbus TaxID=310955 RepID=A0A914YDE4_9BILA